MNQKGYDETWFFKLELKPNLQYQTTLDADLTITRATINPDATSDQIARLFISAGSHSPQPVVQLDGINVTTAPLNFQAFEGNEIKLRVAGTASIDVIGYYSKPKTEEKDEQQFVASRFELGANPSFY